MALVYTHTELECCVDVCFFFNYRSRNAFLQSARQGCPIGVALAQSWACDGQGLLLRLWVWHAATLPALIAKTNQAVRQWLCKPTWEEHEPLSRKIVFITKISQWLPWWVFPLLFCTCYLGEPFSNVFWLQGLPFPLFVTFRVWLVGPLYQNYVERLLKMNSWAHPGRIVLVSGLGHENLP